MFIILSPDQNAGTMNKTFELIWQKPHTRRTWVMIKYWRIAASALVIDKKHEALFENLPQFLGPISVIGIV
ncbi:hypothetical protein DYY65_10125 [Nitrososphaera sp. AFS]|nr:hypothetical protein [Nitrososphaera sp. AFS]